MVVVNTDNPFKLSHFSGRIGTVEVFLLNHGIFWARETAYLKSIRVTLKYTRQKVVQQITNVLTYRK